MSKWIPALITCLALGPFAAGCGSDEEEPGKDEVDTATQETDRAAENPPAGEITEVGMQDIQYKPDSVTVATGGIVKWTNDDPIEHTVTYESGPGEKFDSKSLASGDTFEQSFDAAGTIDYVCTIHPQQKGKVVVK
ncbi:MAG: cupredoxin domain-containing protein [Thermoleophilaceae bacterium]|nr:cupredoxin domain-containing protein [Thermoleophilaceae bacterium]